MMNKFKSLRKTHPIMKIINSSLIDLPTPSNISTWWNFGSLLALCLITQILTGLFLTMYYTANIELAFYSVNYICRNVNYGWLIRTLHANGASFFFMCIYLHIGRGIYYESFNLKYTWMVGVIILFLLMATAFMGYVLPWGQNIILSSYSNYKPFIRNPLFSNYISKLNLSSICSWWRNSYTILYFSFFTPLYFNNNNNNPLIISPPNWIHNPLGLMATWMKSLSTHFLHMSHLGFIILLFFLVMLTMMNPYLLSDPDNFIPANPLVTPIHIQPEWYFLFAYAILRSIPNKLGGVIALIMSILILIILPLTFNKKMQGIQFYPINQIMFWILITIIILLTWIGARPVETPYIITGQMLTIFYFSFFILNPLTTLYWDKLIFN
uniref:Cytochrome b n=1 Tax=Kunugia undans TaxID=1906388 RepID=A0A343C5Y0_9NEOP|nr:cytochrome b [Kunugia undans]